jgi:hypothetical protein
MHKPRNRWIDGAIGAAALLSAIELCSAVSMPLSRSPASALLFASSFFGIQRLYAAVVDVLIIIVKRRVPQGKLSA